MKELSIEEKAKRYDEAIKLAKDSYNYPSYPGFIRADVVFPELKENVDEEIKKALIIYHSSTGSTHVLDKFTSKQICDWLEKQGNTPKEATYTYEVETGNGNIKALVTEKVQLPKFKVGDTIVEKEFDECGYGTIKDITDGQYIFTDGTSMNIDEQEGWQLVKSFKGKTLIK